MTVGSKPSSSQTVPKAQFLGADLTVAALVAQLTHRGIRLWADQGKLRLQGPKGILTPQWQTEIAARKEEILAYIRSDLRSDHPTATRPNRGSIAGSNKDTSPAGSPSITASGLSLSTIGQLIGGGKGAAPTIAPEAMAKQLKVTLRPLPARVPETVLSFRQQLASQLEAQGVTLVPWEAATRDFHTPMPLIGRFLPKRFRLTTRVVRSEINAVIDVSRPVNRLKSWLAEGLYRLAKHPLQSSAQPMAVAEITRRIGWAEDHVIQRLEDPTATQVIVLTEQDPQFTDPKLPYLEKIGLGVRTLVSQFAEVVIGVSADQLSILNMNLSDSCFPRAQLENFVVRSLIPKLYVPIAPLPLGRFEVGHYEPAQSPYAQKLAELSAALAPTGLLPSGFKLAEVVKRASHRDIVSALVNGRTGVSYGFVAFAEPPVYVGPEELEADDWEALAPVPGFAAEELRQNSQGRRYVKTRLQGQPRYRQIPDIWLVCSRSGADKTHLDLGRDILRLGLSDRLHLQVADGLDPARADIKPSYDTYVMVAIALAAALYTPELVAKGAPMVHFHGYPAPHWFMAQEAYGGTGNPAVPCGTYESGVFNFLSLHQLASSPERPLSLVGLVEPDHGINLLAKDLPYLLQRLEAGIEAADIELGGKYLEALRTDQAAIPLEDAAIAGRQHP